MIEVLCIRFIFDIWHLNSRREKDTKAYQVAVKSITVNLFCNAALWILDSKSLNVCDSCTAPPRIARMSSWWHDVVDVFDCRWWLRGTTPNGRLLPVAAKMGDAAANTINDINSSFILDGSSMLELECARTLCHYVGVTTRITPPTKLVSRGGFSTIFIVWRPVLAIGPLAGRRYSRGFR